MSAKLKESYGRTRHDLEMLQFLLSAPQHNSALSNDDIVHRGWVKQRDAAIKALLQNIFRKSSKGAVITVTGFNVRVMTPTGDLNIPAGYLDRMYFGTFPYVTSVILTNKYGGTMGNWSNVGHPEFI